MNIRRFVAIGLFGLVLPAAVIADESSVRISSFASTEFNFLNSGSSLFWPADQEFNSQDRQKLFWQNKLDINLKSDYVRFWANAATFADGFNQPSSLGLEATALLPLEILVEGLRIGLCHSWVQNLHENYLDKGIKSTGLHLNFEFPEYIYKFHVRHDYQWMQMFVNYNFIHQDAAAYLFTRRAKTGFIGREDRLKWTLGVIIGQDAEIAETNLNININYSEKGLASLTARREDLYRIYRPLYAGIYLGYNRNLHKMARFGRDEWLLGVIVKVYLNR